MRFYMPQWMYELLPVAYLVGGAFTFFVFDHWTGHAAGLVLVLTCITVSAMRYRERTRPPRKVRDIDAPLLALTWLRGYEYDIPEIDRDHKQLCEMSHALIQLVEERRHHEFHQQVSDVCHAILEHFTREEEAIRALVPTQLSETQLRSHIQCHQKLALRLQKVMLRFERGMVSRTQLLQFILIDVIRGHMLKDDSVALSGYTPAHAARMPTLHHA